MAAAAAAAREVGARLQAAPRCVPLTEAERAEDFQLQVRVQRLEGHRRPPHVVARSGARLHARSASGNQRRVIGEQESCLPQRGRALLDVSATSEAPRARTKDQQSLHLRPWDPGLETRQASGNGPRSRSGRSPERAGWEGESAQPAALPPARGGAPSHRSHPSPPDSGLPTAFVAHISTNPAFNPILSGVLGGTAPAARPAALVLPPCKAAMRGPSRTVHGPACWRAARLSCQAAA